MRQFRPGFKGKFRRQSASKIVVAQIKNLNAWERCEMVATRRRERQCKFTKCRAESTLRPGSPRSMRPGRFSTNPVIPCLSTTSPNGHQIEIKAHHWRSASARTHDLCSKAPRHEKHKHTRGATRDLIVSTIEKYKLITAWNNSQQ
jgi:hypothetical protein